MALLEVKNLKKYFYGPKGAVHAVDDVTMSIDAGQTMGVVGESGCGKSTLGRTIIHLQKATDGQVLFDRRDITNPTKEELKRLRSDIQIIFQDPYSSLNPRMTVEDTIREPLLISGRCTGANVDAETERLMDMVGIARRIKMSYPHELDGGRRQRVGIARALALNPKFIVCDEPVSALDVSIQAQILNLLMDLQEEQGLAYMFITHNMSVVRHISHNISVMYLGQLVETSPTKELFEEPLHPYTKGLLNSIPKVGRTEGDLQTIEGAVPSIYNLPAGCAFSNRCGECGRICKGKEPPTLQLEDGRVVKCWKYTPQWGEEGANHE